MKTKNYKAAVETEIVCSPDGQNTYSVTKRLPGQEGGKGVMVLLYPTRTKDNLYAEDSTLGHLVAHMGELGLNELTVINLFSQVVEGKLSARGLEVDSENLKFIDELMKQENVGFDKFIVAWGSSMATSYACQRAKAELLNIFRANFPKGKAYQLMTTDIDLRTEFAHPLFLGIRGKNGLWSLSEIHITKEMLALPEKKVAENIVVLKED